MLLIQKYFYVYLLLLSRVKAPIINCPPAMRDRQCFSLGLILQTSSIVLAGFLFFRNKNYDKTG